MQACTSSVASLCGAPVAASRRTLHRSRACTAVVCAKKSGARRPLGFVEEDNSGKSNIFGVEPKFVYTSSPRSDRAARQGLGGAQGLGLVLGLAALVGLLTVVVAKQPDQLVATGESLSAIAQRISATI